MTMSNKISRFITMVLRHKPETIGITLDKAGWVDVSILLKALKDHGRAVTPEELVEEVKNNSKQRYALSADGKRIRASQGHSIEVDLQYKPAIPPDILYHGTATRHVASIFQNGIIKGERHHVHMSKDTETAISVGKRHGNPMVLQIDAKQMNADGVIFYVSDNGVWLTDIVAPKYLTIVPVENV
jgi:putative RNA 2'-phosphotransferase